MRFGMVVLFVGTISAVIYTTEGVLSQNYNLDEFQVATGYLKDRDPSLFSKDFIWGKPAMIQNLHVCVRAVMRATDGLTFGMIKEPIDLFILWIPICVLIFFLGIYLFCFHFTLDRWASLLVACSFMLVRRTIWDWWGIGPMFTMSARGLVLSLLPLGLWAFFQCDGKWKRLAPCFLGWGLVSNLHPLSGWGFVEFLGITILIAEKFHPEAWLKVMIMGCCTIIGSIPFLLIWTKVIAIPVSLQADPTVTKIFWDGFMGLEPAPAKFFYQFIQDLIPPLALAVGGFMVWRRTNQHGNLISMRILYYFPLVVVITTMAVMFFGYYLRKAGISLPVMVPEHSRNIKFIYLTLSVWMAFAFAGWFRAHLHSSRMLRWIPPFLCLLVLLSINFPGHKLARHLFVQMGFTSEADAKQYQTALQDNLSDREVALWVREKTPSDALFYFDSYEFRYYARRSLVFCWFDRPCVGFRPTKDLEEWIARRDRIKPLKDKGSTEEMLIAAREYKADYLVVLKDWKPLTSKTPVWSNSKYLVYAVRNELRTEN